MTDQPTWKRIRRTSQILDPHFEPERTEGGHLRVQAEITLRPKPPTNWWNLFYRIQTGNQRVLPHAEWDDKITVHMTTTDSTMVGDISRLDADIAAANREYERLILPAQSAAMSAAHADTEHLNDVTKKLASIPPARHRKRQ